MRVVLIVLLSLFLISPTSTGASEHLVDEDLPPYRPQSGVSGSIRSVGSDTMNDLMSSWAEGFRRYYPNVSVEVEGQGSSTAVPALVEGRATFGLLTRRLKEKEQTRIRQRRGREATQLVVGSQMLAVFVHKDNPIRGLDLKQLRGLLSEARDQAATPAIRTWGQLGLTGPWAQRPIHCHARLVDMAWAARWRLRLEVGAASERRLWRRFGRRRVLRADSVSHDRGAEVVQAVAQDPGAVGLASVAFATDRVRVLPLRKGDGDFFEARPDSADRYPLGRQLVLTLVGPVDLELDRLRAEFLRWVFSRQGQERVRRAGFLPVDAAHAAGELATAGVPLRPRSVESQWKFLLRAYKADAPLVRKTAIWSAAQAAIFEDIAASSPLSLHLRAREIPHDAWLAAIRGPELRRLLEARPLAGALSERLDALAAAQAREAAHGFSRRPFLDAYAAFAADVLRTRAGEHAATPWPRHRLSVQIARPSDRGVAAGVTAQYVPEFWYLLEGAESSRWWPVPDTSFGPASARLPAGRYYVRAHRFPSNVAGKPVVVDLRSDELVEVALPPPAQGN